MGDLVGSYTSFIFPDPKYVSWPVGTKKVCDDVVNNKTAANMLGIVDDKITTYLLDGRQLTASGTVKELNGIPVGGAWRSPPDPRDVYPYPGFLERSNVAWEILAKSNPNVPHVAVPSFVGEAFSGIVSSLKNSLEEVLDKKYLETVSVEQQQAYYKAIGSTKTTEHFKSIASGTVGAHFGAIPVIQDLKKMFQYHKEVRERFRWLKNLSEGKSIKRKVQLGSDYQRGPVGEEHVLHSETCLVKGKYVTHYAKREWGSVQWKLEPWFEIPTESHELFELIDNLVWDFSIDGFLAMVWELCPWSWFLDWFVGVGSVMNATRNQVPLTHSHLCMMRTSRAIRKYQTTEFPGWVSLSGTKLESRERKERILVAPQLPFPVTVPAVTGRQWSILAGISFLKAANQSS
jgi:hypothetical protein